MSTDQDRRTEFIRQLGKGRAVEFAAAVANCQREEADRWAVEVGWPDELKVRRAAADIERDREAIRIGRVSPVPIDLPPAPEPKPRPVVRSIPAPAARAILPPAVPEQRAAPTELPRLRPVSVEPEPTVTDSDAGAAAEPGIVDELARRWAAGEPVRQIADELAVSVSTVQRLRRTHGIERRNKALDQAQVVALYAEHRSVERVAAVLEVSTAAVRYQLQLAGVATRAPGDNGTRLPDVTRNRAVAAYAAGKAITDILEEFGIVETTLTRWRREAGLPVRASKRRTSAGGAPATPPAAKGEVAADPADAAPLDVVDVTVAAPSWTREAIAAAIQDAAAKSGPPPSRAAAASMLARHIVLVLDSVAGYFSDVPAAGTQGLCLCGDPEGDHPDSGPCTHRSCGCSRFHTRQHPQGRWRPEQGPRICCRCGRVVPADYIAETGYVRHRSCLDPPPPDPAA